MKIGVVGAGAIGGWVGARFAGAGHAVSFLARGTTLAALQTRGIGLTEGDDTQFFPCSASDDPAKIGLQDIVLISVKAQNLPDLAPSLRPMIGPDTLVVPMLNGVPWWFMGEVMPLRSVDPRGTVAASIPRQNVVGCVVHAAAASPEKGVSKLHFCDRIILGEPDGKPTPRVKRITDQFQSSNINATITSDVRTEVWFKLWGNMTMNPMSALTLAPIDRLLADPLLRDLAQSIMEEAQQIGERIGCPITQSGEERMEVTRRLGAFKTSMLQDVEAGRPLELDALLAAPIEIAASMGIATPNLCGLFGLARVMAQSRGLYPSVNQG